VVEAAAAAACAVLATRAGSVLELVALCWVAAFGVALAFIDIAAHRLPDRLTLPAYGGALLLLGAVGLVEGRPRAFGTAVVCGAAVAVGYLVLVVVFPAGIGLGDGKLALSVGVGALAAIALAG
jgi:leader peptidase (prepilin peptidase)/N-methyltransferase